MIREFPPRIPRQNSFSADNSRGEHFLPDEVGGSDIRVLSDMDPSRSA